MYYLLPPSSFLLPPQPTLETIEMLGIADQIDSVMCVDDGLPPKPAPEQIWKICHDLNVHPANAIMVT